MPWSTILPDFHSLVLDTTLWALPPQSHLLDNLSVHHQLPQLHEPTPHSLGDIPEEYSGEENNEAEEDFVPGDNWDIVELNMRPYEPISTSIPSELASLLLYKNSRLHTMLHTTSKLAIVVEMSGELQEEFPAG